MYRLAQIHTICLRSFVIETRSQGSLSLPTFHVTVYMHVCLDSESYHHSYVKFIQVGDRCNGISSRCPRDVALMRLGETIQNPDANILKDFTN